MGDGTHRPWSEIPTVLPADQIAAVRAARDFLGTASSPTASDGTAAIPTIPTATVPGTPIWSSLPAPQRRVATSMLVFGIVVSLVFIGFGTWLVWRQHQVLISYRPVSASVLSTDVVTIQDDEGQATQRPVVRYAYQVAGISYTSDRVTTLNESRSGGWAWEVANRCTTGQLVTAYYNPLRPGQAFLDHTGSLLPWFLWCSL